MDPHDHNPDEQAVLAVLAGNPISEVAAQARTSTARLAEAVELYRAAGRVALDARPQLLGWHQMNIEFTNYANAERAFRTHLLPGLRTGPVAEWWFVRKHPCWRLRIHPGPDATTGAAIEHIAEALDHMVTREAAECWSTHLYEAEIIAFGGLDGMAVSHTLFHTDSLGVLDYFQHLSCGTRGLPDAKVTSLLIITQLLRSAGLEWGEQGDVWGQVEEKRQMPNSVAPDQVRGTVETLRRLLMTDANPALHNGRLSPLLAWATGIQCGGRALAEAAREGRLHLGLRGILARHILFHWNRMGFTGRQQAIWARAAREATLGR